MGGKVILFTFVRPRGFDVQGILNGKSVKADAKVGRYCLPKEKV